MLNSSMKTRPRNCRGRSGSSVLTLLKFSPVVFWPLFAGGWAWAQDQAQKSPARMERATGGGSQRQNIRDAAAVEATADEVRRAQEALRVAVEKHLNAVEAAMKTTQERADHYAAALKDTASALQRAQEALGYKSNDPATAAASSNIEKLGQQYATAMRDGQAAFDRKDYFTATAKADVALGIKPNDPVAAKLKSDAQAELTRLADEGARKQKYDVAIAAAKSAWQQQKYDVVITQADAALAIKTSDPAAGKLKSDAQAELDKLAAVKEQEQQAAEAKAKALQQLDETFEVLLVQYAVLSPTNPRIRAPKAKSERPIKIAIGFDQRDADQRTVGKLKASFQQNGVLNQDDRQDLLAKLGRNITAHD